SSESDLTDLAVLPVAPAGSVERRSAEQLPWRQPADRVQQQQCHGQDRRQPVVAAPAFGAVRARRTGPAHALPRRNQSANGAAGPNAPPQWRGTDARAFTEYLNNYTLQDNLQWTRGKHALTFGFQGQRMDADERERTYGSLATFGFSNTQTAGFSSTGTLLAT